MVDAVGQQDCEETTAAGELYRSAVPFHTVILPLIVPPVFTFVVGAPARIERAGRWWAQAASLVAVEQSSVPTTPAALMLWKGDYPRSHSSQVGHTELPAFASSSSGTTYGDGSWFPTMTSATECLRILEHDHESTSGTPAPSPNESVSVAPTEAAVRPIFVAHNHRGRVALIAGRWIGVLGTLTPGSGRYGCGSWTPERDDWGPQIRSTDPACPERRLRSRTWVPGRRR